LKKGEGRGEVKGGVGGEGVCSDFLLNVKREREERKGVRIRTDRGVITTGKEEKGKRNRRTKNDIDGEHH